MRDEIMLGEVADALPRDEAQAIFAAAIAARLGVSELLATRALNLLIVGGVAKCGGAPLPVYWWIAPPAELSAQPVRMEPGAAESHASKRRAEYTLELHKAEPNAPKGSKLSAVQDYFKIVNARARVYFNLARERTEDFAKKQGGTDDARLIRLRVEYLALEEALELVDKQIARLKRPKPSVPAKTETQGATEPATGPRSGPGATEISA